MHYKPKQYAQALYAMTTDATDTDAVKFCDQFVACLKDARQEHLLGSILKSYQELLIKKNVSPEVIVRSAEKLSQEKIHAILTALDISTDRPVTAIVEGEMIGGVFVKDNNHAFDLSLKRRLARLEQKLQSL